MISHNGATFQFFFIYFPMKPLCISFPICGNFIHIKPVLSFFQHFLYKINKKLSDNMKYCQRASVSLSQILHANAVHIVEVLVFPDHSPDKGIRTASASRMD